MPYSQAHRYQEVEIKTASPTELVVLLYDAAIAGLQKAQERLAAHDIAGRVRCLNKVTSILTELQANLNFEAGGGIASSLERLYRYMKDLVFRANLQQDTAPLKECVKLLCSLRSAWAEVAQAEKGKARPDGAAAATTAPAAPALSMATPGPAASALANLNITA
ncbi:MAG: flagellar export chaperone FliS [Acidobacteriia bacterium]|nr:flagellar export chaperone FliS [Terriglobia bacterium]